MSDPRTARRLMIPGIPRCTCMARAAATRRMRRSATATRSWPKGNGQEAKLAFAGHVLMIKAKIGLLEPATARGNVSQACKVMGYGSDSFYRFTELYEQGGEAAPQELSKRRPVLKSRVAPVIEAAVVALAIERPTWGQVR